MCGVGFLVSLMSRCVAPHYHWNTSNEKHGKKESNEGESAEVHIKISRPHQCQLSNDTSPDTCDRRRNSIESNDAKEMKQVVQEAKPVSLEEANIVPVIPSLNRRRVPGKIRSPALRNQLEDITNEFSEINNGSARLVQAQIEVHPRMCSSTSHETLDSTKYKSLEPVFGNLEPVNNNDCSNNEKTKKLPLIRKKMKNFKRIFICSRSEKSMVLNGFETDESQRLNLASPVSGSRVPAAQSTMLQKSAQVNVSSSTKINANTLQETGPRDDGTSTKRNDSREYSESSNEEKEQLSSRTKASQEMMSLINRQSIDGKSMCDIRINGLTMNQSDLLDLFEATEGKARSVSMMTTEEAQIISIKFYRRKNGDETVQTEDDSQKQSGAPNLMIPPIYVSDYSINETSYRSFPKMKKNDSNCPACRGTRRRTFWKAKIT